MPWRGSQLREPHGDIEKYLAREHRKEYRYQAISVLLESDSDLSYHQSSGDRRKPF